MTALSKIIKKDLAISRMTAAKMSQYCATLLQLLVRMKAADKDGMCACVTCFTVRHYQDRMQGGHYVPNYWSGTRLLEENIHPQCKRCNQHGEQSKTQYALFIIDMYGLDFLYELEDLRRQGTKWNKKELIKLSEELIERINYQHERIHGEEKL